MAAIQDNEGRRGLFGEWVTEYPVDITMGAKAIAEHIHRLVDERFDPSGGALQYFHVLKGWIPTDLETVRTQLLEHLKEPIRRHNSLEEVTLQEPQLTFTSGGMQIRKLGEPRTSWRMDLSMALVERKGDGNVRHDRATNSFIGQPKGTFSSPLSFSLRQLAR